MQRAQLIWHSAPLMAADKPGVAGSSARRSSHVSGSLCQWRGGGLRVGGGVEKVALSLLMKP